jgi:hypothetical protein
MLVAARATSWEPLQPKSGRAFTLAYRGRTTANWVDFLEQVDQGVGPQPEIIFAIVDNLSTHRAADVLLFSLTHPRWHFVFQPTTRRLPQADRSVVEDPAFACPQGSAL